MEFTALQIAELLEGVVEGDDSIVVNDLSTIENGKPNTLTFLANPAYTEYVYTTAASIAIVSKSFKAERSLPSSLSLVKVEDPRLAIAKLMELYAQMAKKPAGVHPSAIIDATAQISDSVYIGPNAVVEAGVKIGARSSIAALSFIGEGASIGSNTVIHERVHIGNRSVIGNECMIQPGVIVGGDGFGFAPNAKNQYQKVVHLGNVVIEDYVEIGAGTTIDRASLGSTIIRKGVKLDNLIQIAHNVEIGENTVIAAQTGIAGSTKIGKNCMIGGQVGIVGHLTISDEVKIAAQSGIGGSIKTKGQIVQGSPALPIGDFKKSYVHFRNLHQLSDSITEIKNKLPKTDNHG
ncbi:UDP-3-O-(3-hydroxymyristoyl)glucosamine N-acyltransferase [Salibacteraceae bacterium]|nr:UDP-3-O-(3-hydroxymyristoyl)glucosamine N-acyltransferase [Salibacteraceae bacterium]